LQTSTDPTISENTIGEQENLRARGVTMLLMIFGTPEIVVVFLLILLLFGGSQFPKLAKGLGESIKALKESQHTDKP
jgi:sec-independent protein translocase protein TatA